MRTLNQRTKFRKDLKRMQRQSKDFSKLTAIVTALASDVALPASARPHKLVGDWGGAWECHIGPDWLLIYNLDDTSNTLDLFRTGSHAELF